MNNFIKKIRKYYSNQYVLQTLLYQFYMKDEQEGTIQKQQITKLKAPTSFSKYFNSNRFPIKISLNKVLITKKLNNRFVGLQQPSKKGDDIDLNEVSAKIKQLHRHQNNYTNKGYHKKHKNINRSNQKQEVQSIPELIVEKQPLRFFKQFIQLSKKNKLQQSSIVIFKKKSRNQYNFGPVSKSMILNPNPHSDQTSAQLLTQVDFVDRGRKNIINKSFRSRCKTYAFKQTIPYNQSPKKSRIKREESFRSEQKFGGWDVRYVNRDFEQSTIGYH